MTLRLRSQSASDTSLRVHGEPFDDTQDGSPSTLLGMARGMVSSSNQKGGEPVEPRAKRVEP